MIHFFSLPGASIVAISMASAGCVILQGAALVLSLNRYRPLYRLENMLQAAILMQMLLYSVRIAQVSTNMRDSLVLPSGYLLVRLILFGAISLLAGGLAYQKRDWRPATPIVAGLFMLPFVEGLLGRAFPAWYVLCLVYFTAYGLRICALRRRELKSGISELSIKEAIDALQTGILFCEPDGRIILVNKKMQSLMVLLTGTVWRNGTEYFSHITQGKRLREAEEAELDGRAVFRLQDRSVWMFNDALLTIGTKFYHQITAADVTEKWDAAALLHEQNTALDKRRDELTDTIAHLHAIEQKEEAIRAKSRIHDVLGQQIALLIRSLREGGQPDQALLRAFAADPLAGIHESEKSPKHSLQALIDMMDGIGVDIAMQGELPDDRPIAGAFMEMITEGVTNAIRHGFAKKIDIACQGESDVWTLTIRNGGVPPVGPITEGNGMAGIRRRLRALGGTLLVETSPQFSLKAVLPKEG